MVFTLHPTITYFIQMVLRIIVVCILMKVFLILIDYNWQIPSILQSVSIIRAVMLKLFYKIFLHIFNLMVNWRFLLSVPANTFIKSGGHQFLLLLIAMTISLTWKLWDIPTSSLLPFSQLRHHPHSSNILLYSDLKVWLNLFLQIRSPILQVAQSYC